MKSETYSMSFTTGGIFYHESLLTARLVLETGNWDETRARIIKDNLLQARTQNTLKRVYSEVASRLNRLSTDELRLLTGNPRHDQNHILWLAICKRYHFIRDFAVEVLREKFLERQITLTYPDYEVFFNTKAQWHGEVERIAEATRKKLRRNLFKMMRDLDLISDKNEIMPVLLSENTAKAILKHSPGYMAIFPANHR